MFRHGFLSRSTGRFCRCEQNVPFRPCFVLVNVDTKYFSPLSCKVSFNYSVNSKHRTSKIPHPRPNVSNVLFASSYKDEGEKKSRDVIVRQGAVFDYVVEAERSAKTFQMAIAQYRRVSGSHSRQSSGLGIGFHMCLNRFIAVPICDMHAFLSAPSPYGP